MIRHITVEVRKEFGNSVKNWMDALCAAIADGVPENAYIVNQSDPDPMKLILSWYEDK